VQIQTSTARREDSRNQDLLAGGASRPGKSFETCLVPGGCSKVAWTRTEDYDGTPVTWVAK
jgi:hypothetical protein